MAKRGKSDLFEAYAEGALRLRSSLLLLEKYPELTVWVEALRDIDDSNGTDKASLVELLKSTGDKRDALLADLIDRYDFAKKKSRPRRPAYVMTNEDLELSAANADIEDLRAQDWTLTDAIKHVAARRGIKISQLEDFHANRRRSTRKH